MYIIDWFYVKLKSFFNNIESSIQKNSENPPKKRKPNKPKKSVQEESPEHEAEMSGNKEKNNALLELEIEERKMTLKERSIKARAAEAEARMLEAKAEALEIENIKRKNTT